MEPILIGVNPLDCMGKSKKEIMVGVNPLVDIPIQEAIQQHIELEKEKI